jgi:hypothetical protein
MMDSALLSKKVFLVKIKPNEMIKMSAININNKS